MAGGRRKWLVNVTAYTLAGGAASLLVGALLGILGGWIVPARVGMLGILIAIAVALLALARELSWLAIPLPQRRRQTRDIWAKVFPSTWAAALWGFDLGLVFTTWFTFAGVWLLVIVAILIGSPQFGAALFTAYWLGRALSVWIAPMLLSDATATPQLLDEIVAQYRLFQRMHVVGLAWSIMVLIVWLTQSVAM